MTQAFLDLWQGCTSENHQLREGMASDVGMGFQVLLANLLYALDT